MTRPTARHSEKRPSSTIRPRPADTPASNRRQFLSSPIVAALLHKTARADSKLRVACMDWALAETMLTLGQKPIGIVAAGDWPRFVVDPALPPGVVDLGLQQEINFELLASLKPDLILTSPFLDNAEPTLRKIARTVRVSIYEKSAEPLSQPRAIARILGQQLGCPEAAGEFLRSAERLFDSYRGRIATIDPRPVLLVNFVDPRHVRVYGGAGLYQNVLDRIGVTNAWRGETSYWGYATIGVERLATSRDVQLIAFEPIPPDVRRTLRESPLWAQLPFVRAGHVAELPTMFMFGAMPAALRFARLMVEKLEALGK
jgi:ferric hydroxamate transport system substrate-binding protein